MLCHVHQIKVYLHIHSTGGITKTNWIGLLPGYSWVWYHPTSIANIISLACDIQHHQVTFDSNLDNVFHVHLAGGQVRILKQSKDGLYYSDLKKSAQGTVLVNMVEYNINKYSHADYLRAVEACKLQNIIGNPRFAHFKQLLTSEQLHNCPATLQDVEVFKYLAQASNAPKEKQHVKWSNNSTSPTFCYLYKYCYATLHLLVI